MPQLQEHQQRANEKLEKTKALLVYHSLGSGKTLTSLAAVEKELKENPDSKVLFIVPASLINNVYKEIEYHKLDIPLDRIEVVSYEKAVKDKDKYINGGYKFVILDEAHRIRNPDRKVHNAVKQILQQADKRLMLTGTPMYNSPTDLAVLMNALAGRRVLPDTKKEFEARYIKKKEEEVPFVMKFFLGVKPGEIPVFEPDKQFENVVKRHIDYHNAIESAKEHFPEKEEVWITVPMGKKQQELYNYYLGQIPGPLKWKIKLGLMPDKREAEKLNAFSSAIRQISNTTAAFVKDKEDVEQPKIEAAVASLKAHMQQVPNFRAIVYSNFLDSGLKPYSELLQKEGIPHAIFTGELTQKKKKEIVEKFNKGEIPVLLVSSSGAEGLDLKGVKLVQILEPHFNKSKIDQVVGRAIRYKSHEHLPPEERKVKVEYYVSKVQPGLLDKLIGVGNPKSIDEYLWDVSRRKAEIFEQIKNFIAQMANSGEIPDEKDIETLKSVDPALLQQKNKQRRSRFSIAIDPYFAYQLGMGMLQALTRV